MLKYAASVTSTLVPKFGRPKDCQNPPEAELKVDPSDTSLVRQLWLAEEAAFGSVEHVHIDIDQVFPVLAILADSPSIVFPPVSPPYYSRTRDLLLID
jgi:hypothetical protein